MLGTHEKPRLREQPEFSSVSLKEIVLLNSTFPESAYGDDADSVLPVQISEIRSERYSFTPKHRRSFKKVRFSVRADTGFWAEAVRQKNSAQKDQQNKVCRARPFTGHPNIS